MQELQSVNEFKTNCPTVKDIPALKDISVSFEFQIVPSSLFFLLVES